MAFSVIFEVPLGQKAVPNFGVQPKYEIARRTQINFFSAPRREHSRKPDTLHRIIEACSPGPYLELFAREQRPGWATWGNETGKFAA